MMKQSGLKSRVLGYVAIALTVVMIGTTAAMAAGTGSSVIPDDEIERIISTTTDATQVTSPFIDVANKVKSSVVGVSNYQTYSSNAYGYSYGYGYGRGNRGSGESIEVEQATGSGVVISKYGHVLTNYHVVEDATSLKVTTPTDTYDAQLVCSDEELDLAVLLVPNLPLEPVELGDSDQVQVGEWAICIGNPLGVEFAETVTIGVVSALDREITSYTYDRYGRRVSITNSMIQVDAAINSGNSGGGMFNVLGQLQGIPALKYSGSSSIFSSSASVENIGMCIPVNVAKPLIQQALLLYTGTEQVATAETNTDSGVQVTTGARPRIGVSVGTVSSNYTGILPMGAYVSKVEAGSPAEAAGLLVDDIIVEVDGTVVQTSSEAVNLIGNHEAGDVVTLKVYRSESVENGQYVGDGSVDQGEYIDLSVTLRMMDEDQP